MRPGFDVALVGLVVIVALALGLALATQAWAVKPYQIPSGSMEPTLDVGQRVLVNRFLYHFTDSAIGDIVVGDKRGHATRDALGADSPRGPGPREPNAALPTCG